MVTSDALIGVPLGSLHKRTPSAHIVSFMRAMGSLAGAKSLKRTTAGTGAATMAPMSVFRTKDRLVKPDSLFAWLKISTAASLVSSSPRVGWRSSTSSCPCMRDLAQCTAPIPTPSIATAIPNPTNMLLFRTDCMSPGMMGKTTYATAANTLPTTERRKNSAILRSAFFSSLGSRSVTRRCSGARPGFWGVWRVTTAVPGSTLSCGSCAIAV